MASCTQLATSGCEGRDGEPCICLNKLEKYIYSLVKRIDILKLEKRSNMAGRSEGDKGKKEETYSDEEDVYGMKHWRASKLMGEAMKIIQEGSKSEKKYMKCLGQLEKITFLDGCKDKEDENTDGKLNCLIELYIIGCFDSNRLIQI